MVTLSRSFENFDLPEAIHRNQVLFGDRLIAYPITIPTKGCWQSQFSRMEIASGKTDPWVTIDCARFNLLGDDHIVYSNTGGDAPRKSSEVRMPLYILRPMTPISTSLC